MNKKLLIGGCAAMAVAGNVFAADEEVSYFNSYASLKAGYAFLGKRDNIKYKGGFAGAVEMGVSYDAWRLGLELGCKSNKIKEVPGLGSHDNVRYALNGEWDKIPAGTHIANRDVGTNAAAANASAVAIADKSVFCLHAAGNPSNAIFDIRAGAVGAGNAQLGLKNVTEIKFEKMSAMTGMVNVFYDYAMTDAWSLYGGIGLGVARVNVTVQSRNSGSLTGARLIGTAKAHGAGANDFTVEDAKKAVLAALPKFFDGNGAKWNKTEHSKTVFAWQLMAGVGYEFNENWKLTLGYKLFNTAKVKVMGDEIKAPFNHTFEAGLHYTF